MEEKNVEQKERKTLNPGDVLSIPELESLKCPVCSHKLFESTSNNAYDEVHLHCVPAFHDAALPEGKQGGCGAVFHFRINFAGNPRVEKDFEYVCQW
jgi:hypothetical protein